MKGGGGRVEIRSRVPCGAQPTSFIKPEVPYRTSSFTDRQGKL